MGIVKERKIGNKEGIRTKQRDLFEILISDKVNSARIIHKLYQDKLLGLNEEEKSKKLNTLRVAFYKMVDDQREVPDNIIDRVCEILLEESMTLVKQMSVIVDKRNTNKFFDNLPVEEKHKMLKISGKM